jgi:hypothetical protein
MNDLALRKLGLKLILLGNDFELVFYHFCISCSQIVEVSVEQAVGLPANTFVHSFMWQMIRI